MENFGQLNSDPHIYNREVLEAMSTIDICQEDKTNVGRDRIELSASSLSEKRSTSELTTLI